MKKRIIKVVAIVVGAVVLIAGTGLAYVKLILPDVGPPPDISIRANAAQIEHGRYLANHVAICVDCHSARDWTKLSGPIITGTVGKGGEGFRREQGFPGNYYAPNITPAHIGNWTDGEIYRTITTGVSRDGRALFPVMPYANFGKMDPEDIKAIIAYLRTIQPIENKAIPAPESDFPMNFILNTIPQKAQAGKRPDTTDHLAYGRYMITFASCGDCHTPIDKQGQPLPGMTFAGGREFPLPTGTVRSANLTPHETGLKQMTRQAFVARFKAYSHQEYVSPEVRENEFNSIMPWTMYSGMTEHDLGAIYDYLRTVAPVEHRVERFTPKSKLMASR
ncbi:cytochrome C [Spirosoma taeanense]|uniref:Cytochrome C n=1 Tax=Spirosoma taeanense TaxID=2735870 RepID=A0A6M5Y704_9BACT|nr:cytochrome C [Spirosoma taeanense]QJW89186.1 cytochrome C [Spirosoma taeanense]